jgi:hypothetical protein
LIGGRRRPGALCTSSANPGRRRPGAQGKSSANPGRSLWATLLSTTTTSYRRPRPRRIRKQDPPGALCTSSANPGRWGGGRRRRIHPARIMNCERTSLQRAKNSKKPTITNDTQTTINLPQTATQTTILVFRHSSSSHSEKASFCDRIMVCAAQSSTNSSRLNSH